MRCHLLSSSIHNIVYNNSFIPPILDYSLTLSRNTVTFRCFSYHPLRKSGDIGYASRLGFNVNTLKRGTVLTFSCFPYHPSRKVGDIGNASRDSLTALGRTPFCSFLKHSKISTKIWHKDFQNLEDTFSNRLATLCNLKSRDSWRSNASIASF